jgi:hypothetical protein
VVETPRARPSSTRDAADPGAGTLYCLSYVSTQRQPMSGAALRDLLEQARGFNVNHDISGLLLHRNDSFFQILEGEETVIKDLYARIASDTRHQRLEIVAEGPIEHREFADWQMAFIDLDGQDLSALPGFSDLLLDTPSARAFLQSLSRSKKLALLFSMLR